MSEQTAPADLTDVALAVLGAMEAAGIEGADMHDARLIVDNLTAAGFGPVRAVEVERDALRERIYRLAEGAVFADFTPWPESDDDGRVVPAVPAEDLFALLATSPDREDGAS